MKKNSQIRSKILAVLLTVAILFSTALVSSAYIITLKPNKFTNTDKENRFQAYQIFKGVLNPNNENQLADIEWGANIPPSDNPNFTKFIDELKASGADAGNDQTVGDIFRRDLNSASVDVTAKEVADVLAEYNTFDSSLAQEFAKIVAQYVTDPPVGTSVFDKNVDNGAGRFIIRGLSAGYYLIKDTYKTDLTNDEDTQDVYQPYILEVLNNKDVTLKADAPDVDKKIVTPEGGGELNGDDYNIGDTITFRLIGTLPENYDMFDTYYYKFTDTLSKGLDFIPDTLSVYLLNPPDNAKTVVENQYYNFEGAGAREPDGKDSFTVTFDDLKKLQAPDYNITHETKIVVEYQGKLNSNAVINGPNPNDVNLEFSNDPYKDQDHGKTPDKTVYVYTFGIDVTKVGSNEQQPLPGAEFKIYRKNDDGSIKDYAVVENGKITGWNSDINKGSPIETGADGRFTVDGLDEGTYYLTETKTPDGYDTMEDIEFKIAATIDEDSGELTSSALTPSEGRKYPGDVTASGGVNSDGRFDLELVNQLASILPGTGGIGNIVFYVGGALIIAVAVILFIVTRRKKSAQKQ